MILFSILVFYICGMLHFTDRQRKIHEAQGHKIPLPVLATLSIMWPVLLLSHVTLFLFVRLCYYLAEGNPSPSTESRACPMCGRSLQ